MVAEALGYSDRRFQRCGLHAFVIMPNHVHLLATQLAEVRHQTRDELGLAPFAKWLRPLKGCPAYRANQELGLSRAAFWQNESYDLVVRDGEEFRRSSAGAAWKGG